jgi:hypothetical protein
MSESGFDILSIFDREGELFNLNRWLYSEIKMGTKGNKNLDGSLMMNTYLTQSWLVA